eukprot:Sspe_Gene.893::Locus_302_Transcript_2_2_Confidence_0.500_Length_414::g.893::m.893
MPEVRKQCPHCDYRWLDKYGKNECPKCIQPLWEDSRTTRPMWNIKTDYGYGSRLQPGEVSTNKRKPVGRVRVVVWELQGRAVRTCGSSGSAASAGWAKGTASWGWRAAAAPATTCK